MSTSTSELRPVTSLWWLVALYGLVVLALGVFLIVSPHETLKTFTVLLGIFLLVDGVIAIVGSIFGRGEGRGLLAMIGVLSGIAGLVLIKRPSETLVLLILIVGIWFVVAGVARLVSSFSVPEGRGMAILIGLIDLGAGIVILAWPKLGLSTFAVVVGIFLVLRGALFIASGWALRGAERELAAAG